MSSTTRPALSRAAFATLLLIAFMMGANHVAARMAFDNGVDVATAVAVRSLATAAVVGVIVAQRGSPGIVGAWLAVGAVSVVCALSWAYLFYVPHHLTASAIALAGAAVLTLVLVILTWSVTRGGAIALLPYLIWVSLATSLAFGYARLNA